MIIIEPFTLNIWGKAKSDHFVELLAPCNLVKLRHNFHKRSNKSWNEVIANKVFSGVSTGILGFHEYFCCENFNWYKAKLYFAKEPFQVHMITVAIHCSYNRCKHLSIFCY